jgi:hypothetical protein
MTPSEFAATLIRYGQMIQETLAEGCGLDAASLREVAQALKARGDVSTIRLEIEVTPHDEACGIAWYVQNVDGVFRGRTIGQAWRNYLSHRGPTPTIEDTESVLRQL